ncbi:MAG TPA: hypothetical protein VJ476_05965, partial [Rhizomicrobium sp.]|nr:hypothetical protein [Rhizomicrobium sp.]
MDLKEIQEMIQEVKASDISDRTEANIARAHLLASWVIAEQLAIMNHPRRKVYNLASGDSQL